MVSPVLRNQNESTRASTTVTKPPPSKRVTVDSRKAVVATTYSALVHSRNIPRSDGRQRWSYPVNGGGGSGPLRPFPTSSYGRFRCARVCGTGDQVVGSKLSDTDRR